jgi:ribulose 1,5-bisphosphate carboxylase large subunit-like protein
MRIKAQELFRDKNAHTIAEIRSAFGLDKYEPLLAFSFKPRLGLRFEVLEEVTLDVLKQGFHLVELDARNLQLNEKQINRLVDLAKKAESVGNHQVTRFSPNLSIPSYLIVEIVERFRNAQSDPVVVKIDGGVDGLSSTQAVRRAFSHTPNRRAPIITCYPLLRRQLSRRVPPDTFVDLLALSGVDIIYPGGRPTLVSVGRTLDVAEKGALLGALERYQRMAYRQWPLPTVAAGVYAGELHSFYELFGADAAFFLGGAVALHKDGPKAGAKLCAQVINKAVHLRMHARPGEFASNFSDTLVSEIEAAYDLKIGSRSREYPYLSPKDYLGSVDGLVPWLASS